MTKHAHACVTLDKASGHLLVDPGMFTPNRAELVTSTDTILITHEHPDHFEEELIAAALEDRPELKVYGPSAVVNRWQGRRGKSSPSETATASPSTVSRSRSSENSMLRSTLTSRL